MSHQPEANPGNTSTLAPLLFVRRGASAIEFYKRAFGAVELFRIDDDKGEVVAHMAVGGGEFWLADESPAHQNLSPETLNGTSVRMVLTVEDPDTAFDRAVAAGAAVVRPVSDQSYGWRLGQVADPYGHHWEIGKPLPKCR